MRKFEKLMRLSPYLFVAAAIVDFVKQLLLFLAVWLRYHDQAFTDSDYSFHDGRVTVDLVDRFLALLIYPLGWIGTAIIITLLIQLYDRRTPNA